MTAANNEPTRMPSLAQVTRAASTSPKASDAMKMDIVKPIPHSTPTARIVFWLTPGGSVAHLSFTASAQNRLMPSGLR